MMLNDDSSEDEGVLYFSRNDSITKTTRVTFSANEVDIPNSPLTPISQDDQFNSKPEDDDEVFEDEVNYDQNMDVKPFGNKATFTAKKSVDVDVENLQQENTFLPWEASSLMDGLGWDIKEGKLTDVSLVRVSSLLQNLNLQLIIMTKEVIQVEKAVRDAYAQQKGSELGFEDVNNRLHVSSLIASLSLHSSTLSSSLNHLDLSLSNSTHSIVSPRPSLLLPLSLISLPILSFVAYKICLSFN